MSDGAHLGVSAGRALRTILGGDPPPTADEGMTPDQMRTYLESGHADDAYSEASRVFGAAVLAYLDAHPEARDVPADDDIDSDEWRARTYEGPPIITRKGLYTLLSESGSLAADEGLTGFMVGWGCNAAKYAVGAPPSRNPALLTVEVRDPP